MTPLVRVVCSPFVQLVAASALVATLLIVQLRPAPAVIVVVPAPPAPAMTPITNYVPYYCYGWAPRWSSVNVRPYCGD